MGFVALSGRLGGVSFGRQRGTGACAAAGGGAGDGGEGLSSKEPNTKREPIQKSQDTVVVPAGATVLTASSSVRVKWTHLGEGRVELQASPAELEVSVDPWTDACSDETVCGSASRPHCRLHCPYTGVIN